MEKYVLTLNREQAEIVSRACDLLSRLYIGQFEELKWVFLNMNYDAGVGVEFVANKWDKVIDGLKELKELAFPGAVKNHHYNCAIGDVPIADNGYNVHQALRYCMAYHDHPEGGDTVDFHKPIRLGNAELPGCEVLNDVD